jgi:long-chain acyl-CoA synthetase
VAAIVEDLPPSIVSVVQSNACESPDKVALVAGEFETTYGELWHQIVVAADWYAAAGTKHGDRILISTDSRDPYFAPAYLGAHLAGAIAVPTDFRLSEDDLSKRRNYVDASLVLFGECQDDLRQCLQESGASINDSAASRPIDMSAIAEIMFTTGTTGDPKGVALTHQNISASAILIRQFIGNRSEDSEVVTIPLTHSFGLGRLRSSLLACGKLIVVPGLVFPQLTIQALQQHSATGLSCVPAGMRLLLSRCEESLSAISDQIRYVEMGSAPFSAKEKKRLCQILPSTRICMHYGLTEASRSTFSEFHEDFDHLDSVGRASPGVEIQVLDKNGASLACGEHGRIYIRAATVMSEYWNNPTATDSVLSRTTGWLDTGDLGWLDAQEYLHLAGRADDVINCGGKNILPEDLERIAADFPGVKDVACHGVPDPNAILGHVPRVLVVSDGQTIDAGELLKFLQANYEIKLPVVVLEFVDTIPRSESGKLLRNKLDSITA